MLGAGLGLAATGNACRAGRDDGGKGRYTPQVGFKRRNCALTDMEGGGYNDALMLERMKFGKDG